MRKRPLLGGNSSVRSELEKPVSLLTTCIHSPSRAMLNYHARGTEFRTSGLAVCGLWYSRQWDRIVAPFLPTEQDESCGNRAVRGHGNTQDSLTNL